VTRFAITTVAALAFALSACSTFAAKPAATVPATPAEATPSTPGTLPATRTPVATGAPESPSPSGPASASPTVALDGREFVSVLVTHNGQPMPLVSGTKIRLGFSGGMISASAGCNGISASYELAGGKLVTGEMATTEMGCAAGLADQDQWLASVLASQPTVELSGADLVLTSDTTALTFQDRQQAEPDQPLVGITWGLNTIVATDVASSVPAGVMATLLFDASGDFTFDAGCNSGGGKYATSGDTISFTQIVSTMRACGGGADVVETAVFTILNADHVTYGINHTTLSLNADGHGLQYDAAVDVN